MMTDQLDTAVKNFQHVDQMVERYTRLCRAYVKLSERFHQLDVDHMRLKGQVIPLLKALKAQQTRLHQMQSEKDNLQQTLDQLRQSFDQRATLHRQEMQALTQTYEERLENLSHHISELRPLEVLLSSEVFQELVVAEEQMELVEATIQEMVDDDDPDLSLDEKALLEAYRANPGSFLVES